MFDFIDNKLSDASKMTLEHQGGPMSPAEVEAFEKNKLKDVIIRMRNWDEQAKDVSKFSTPAETKEGLDKISQMLCKHMTDNALFTLPSRSH